MLHLRVGRLAALRLKTPICYRCLNVIRTQPTRLVLAKNFQITSSRSLALSSIVYSEVEPVAIAVNNPTVVSDVTSAATDISATIVDPPFSELGLASGWWPLHWIQSGLETFYVNTGCPWWLTIIAGTCIVRLVTLPIYIETRKYMIKMRNHMPKQQTLMEKLKDAKVNGTSVQKMKASQRLRNHMKTSGTGPIRSLLVNLPMPVLFISMMMALRQMMTVPVPSLEATNFLWLESLCSQDPYYILPLLTGSFIGLTIRLQTKSGMMASPSSTLLKFVDVLPFLPIIGMPLLMGRWPSGICLYMLINTTITMTCIQILSSEKVKEKLNFPILNEESQKKTSLRKVWKEMYADAKEGATRRQELSEMKAIQKKKVKDRKKALKGPPPVTYEIGTEAIRKEHVPDYIAMWNTKPPNIYSRK